jgi:hypothetical protein
MRVIKRGSGQTGWAKEKKCTGKGNGDGGCGAVLLVEEGDLFVTESHCHIETTRYITFKCAECGILTDFDNDHEVPDRLWRNLPMRKDWEKRHETPAEAAGR